MIGAGHEELEESYLGEIALHSRPDAPVVLRRERTDAAPRAYRDVTFEARAGEVLGIYGFMGCRPARARAHAVRQASRPSAARSTSTARPVRLRNTAAARRAGIAFVAGKPARDAVRRGAGLQEHLDRASSSACRAWLLKPDRERAIASAQIKKLDIRPPESDGRLGTLSGGNQQKVALAKWLTDPPRMLVLSEPTRGMDVGAKDDVVKIVRALRDQGIAHHRRLDRARDGAVARRPDPGDAQGRDRARIRRRSDQQGPPAGGGLRGIATPMNAPAPT